MLKYEKPNGTIIEINEHNVEIAEGMGWKPHKPKAKPKPKPKAKPKKA